MSGHEDPIRPPRPWWHKWMWTGLVVVLVAGVVVGVLAVVRAGRICDSGVEKRGDDSECVGVTDGSYVFSPDLADVEARIRKENADAQREDAQYVTIAVLLPMTLTGDDIVDRDWVRRQVEGAYLAQYRANRNTWGSRPLIRLLLANPGSRFEQWQPVVDDLLARESAEHLVAVTGIGLSLDAARQAVTKLSEHQIPVVASQVAADEFSQIPGFLRVSPTSSGYGKALAGFVKPTAHTATIVQDQNRADLYPATLAEAFRKRFADAEHTINPRIEPYDSSLPGIETTFLQMMPTICAAPPDVLYFAGREDDLASFVSQLAVRQCADKPLTVLTGDLGLIGTPNADMQRGLRANVTVLAPGLAHPQAWASEPDTFDDVAVANFEGPSCTDCFEALFPHERLDDGVAILAHDAVLTVVWAVRESPHPMSMQFTAQDVLQARNRLHDKNAVPGASGTLSFDEHGDPVNKPVPILRVRLGSTPEFLRLSTPDG